MAGEGDWRVRANRTQGWRAVGGHLAVTGGRVEFTPHAFDSALAGTTWSADLGSIRSVGEEGRTFNPFNGGLRRRLRLELEDGSVELFVVNKLDDVVEHLAAVSGR